MRLTKNWKQEIKNFFNITYIEDYTFLLSDKNTIFVTRCSKIKSDKQSCLPKDYYMGEQNIRFFDECESNDISYAILSDYYGIVFYDEIINSYDLHPKDLTIENKKELGNTIATKCRERGYTTIIFYNTSPFMNLPYFEMLSYSGLEIYYTSKLIKGIKYKKSIPICINL